MTRIAASHIVITGGSQGIGYELARQASRRGAFVSIIARDEDRLAAAAAEIGCQWAAADVCDQAALNEAVASLGTRTVDVGVACAGMALPAEFGDATDAEFRRQMEVNFHGAVNLTRALYPTFSRLGAVDGAGAGHLVFVSSVAGLVGVPGYTGYSASKWALRGFAESLRFEMTPLNTTVSVAYPPDTDTPGFAAENLRKPASTQVVSEGSKTRTPAEVASVILAGIEADRCDITFDAQSTLLLRVGGAIAPAVRSHLNRKLAKLHRSRRPVGVYRP